MDMNSRAERVVEVVQQGERKHRDGGMSSADVLDLLTEEEKRLFGEERVFGSESRGMHMLKLLNRLTELGMLHPSRPATRSYFRRMPDGRREEVWYTTRVW